MPSEEYPLNPAAFDFLKKCHGSQFDLTSAEAISLAPQGVLLTLKKDINYRQFTGQSQGSDEALQGGVDFFNRHGVPCSKENVALNEHILSAITTIYRLKKLHKGGKVLVPTPTFGYYFKQFQSEEIEFVTFPTRRENDFLPDPAELETALIASGAKVLLLCYPNNPTGVVMTPEIAAAKY